MFTNKKGLLLGPGQVKKGALASSRFHVPKFVECLPSERWAVSSLVIIIIIIIITIIIIINYCVQGIELFQKLYIGLEYVVTKNIGKSSKINKVVREFCKFSQRVKAVSVMGKNCKYPGVDGYIARFQH